MLVALLWSSVAAHAAPFAEVTGLWALDDAGRLDAVKATAEVAVVTAAGEQALEKGSALDAGVHLVARQGKAEVTLESGNVLVLSPGAELIVHEPTVIEQVLGAVSYAVSGAFSVRYGSTYCTVEGTRFDVRGPTATDGLQVAVTQGKVRVKTPQGEVLVKKKHQVEVAEDGALGALEDYRYCGLCGYYHVPH